MGGSLKEQMDEVVDAVELGDDESDAVLQGEDGGDELHGDLLFRYEQDRLFG